MSALIDDMSELMERTEHAERLLMLCIKHFNNYAFVHNDHSIGTAAHDGRAVKDLAGLVEVEEWWKERQKNDKEAQTKELQRLANGIWECYENNNKYIDPTDVQRIVELARNARVE
ncbi:hypothetical protein LCGC14_0459410 [marine sediment metagenome]|uniref:Uncharacterized protein n=1 Tax=marine sediment metagenome TaxID=412755 RepID=A0A0F9SYF4_9ZZZZ